MSAKFTVDDLYLQARRFSEAAKIIEDKIRTDARAQSLSADLMTPVAVILSFGCELILKALLLDVGIGHGNKHGLKELFDKLPQNVQLMVEQNTCSNSGISTSMFAYNMDEADKVFVNWRYVYENPGKGVNFSFLKVLHASVEAILLINHPHLRLSYIN